MTATKIRISPNRIGIASSFPNIVRSEREVNLGFQVLKDRTTARGAASQAPQLAGYAFLAHYNVGTSQKRHGDGKMWMSWVLAG